MFYHPETQRKINEGTAFEIKGTQYPQNWLNLTTSAEKTAAGIFDLVVQNMPVFNPETQLCIPSGVQLLSDTWTETWSVVSLPEETIRNKLASTRTALVAKIKAERDRRQLNGVFVQSKWFHSDIYSRTQWMGMVAMGASVPVIEWKTMDGTSITTSQTLASKVLRATVQLDADLFDYAQNLIADVDTSTNPNSIDITNGWPATYLRLDTRT